MDSPKYAPLLEQLCLAADTHDWITFDQLLFRVRAAHDQYNAERIARGGQPARIHEESWKALSQEAHRLVWN